MIFATQNKHKAKEVAAVTGLKELKTLNDIGVIDIEETGKSLEDNALIKSRYVLKHFNESCFADDSGLFIEGLSGEPGVYSARYAGEHKSDADNIQLVLDRLKDIQNRKAKFVTVIAYSTLTGDFLFEGILDGSIAYEPKGDKGFGYDPIFIPDGYEKTLAELTPEEKNAISHRAIAVRKFADFLNQH